MAHRQVERLDAFQRRHAAVGVPIATVYKFVDDQGSYLTAIITYYGLVSLFPLLLLLVTVSGFLLEGDPGLQRDLVDSALSRLPVVGDEIRANVGTFRGSGVGLVVGVLGSVYGALGVAQAIQNAFNKVWAVPRNERPNVVLSRVRSVGLILLMAVAVIVTTALSALTTASREAAGGGLGPTVRVVAFLVSISANVVLLLLAFRLGTARQVRMQDLRTGAMAAAVAWQLLQIAGTYLVSRLLTNATRVYGLFGVLLGLLAWIYLLALVLVVCAEVNAVLHRRLWPRALLAPVTDEAPLTAADEKAYTSYAAAERFKGFEAVEVSFDDGGSRPGPPPPSGGPPEKPAAG